MIDIEEIDEKTGKEEEQGKVYQRREHPDSPSEAHFIDPVCIECTDPGTVVWAIPCGLSDSEVPT